MRQTGNNNQGRYISRYITPSFTRASVAIVRTAVVSFFFIGTILILTTCLSHARAAEKVQPANPITLPSTSLKTIIVGNYQPYTFVNDKGIPDGFSVDVAKAVTRVMDLQLEIRADTWEHATESLSNGSIDLLPMMAFSPERDKIYDFSAPHTIAYDAVFSRIGAQRIRSLEDLVDKTVIVMNKDTAHQYLLSSGMAAKMKLILVDSLPDALRTLAEGKGDAALMPKLVGLVITKKLNLTNLDPSSVVINAYKRPFSFAVKDGNQALLERLSQGLSIIKSTGQYQEIYNKWFGALEPPGLPWKTVIKYVAVIVAVFLLIALGLIFWTVSLRKQVASRTKNLAAEIQERKQAEEALRGEENLYRSLFENMLNGFAYCQMHFDDDDSPWDFTYLSVNSAFETLTGLRNVVGKKVTEVIPGIREADPELLEIYGRVAKTGNPERFEMFVDALQMWFWISVYSPERGYFVAVFDVITERKRAEDKLRETEKEYRDLYESAPVGYCEYDTEGRITNVNQTTLGMLGYGREEMIGRYIWEFNKEEDVARQQILEKLAGLRPLGRNLERTYRRKDGVTFPVLIEDRIKTAEQGRIVGMRFTIQDITERKRTEEAIVVAKNDWENTFDSVTDIITIHDEGFNIVRANLAAKAILGLHLQEGMPLAKCFKSYHGTETPPAECPSCQCFQTGKPCTVEVFEPYLNKYLEIRAMPRLGRDGRPIGLIHVVRDITELKRTGAEKAKLEAQFQQSQKMESVGRLAGGVAHDFNNMLGLILGHAELALEQIDPDHPLAADLQEIRKAAERSSDLTRQLLAFARQQTVAPKVLDMNETVANMLNMLQRLIGEDIDLKWQSGANLWSVKMDPTQIDQILANLCVNARDAISDTGKITIETGNISLNEAYCADHAGFVPGEYVMLIVSDDGCGMDKETAGKIFEPFFTTKEVGKGTGLGLATVYGIVKQNSGFINVYSEPGQGTTFTIYLPRHLGKSEEVQAARPQEPLIRGRETVLLVEDEPALLKLNKRLLGTQGYRVLAAGSPREAIRLAGEYEGNIHLLMTDVVMPEMNGRDLADKMLSLNPNLKCLFTSGYTANVIARHGVLDENVHFIQKPFSRRDLAAKVREVLDRKS